MVKLLDTLDHPTRPGTKVSAHTHIIVVSEFCRTPQLNPAGGRDHYPNNSALIISPRFASRVVGETDAEQLLPIASASAFAGRRVLSAADVLASILAAFAIPPQRYLRDGEPVPELLA
jgi:uncharacterized protein (DUF1501 family)